MVKSLGFSEAMRVALFTSGGTMGEHALQALSSRHEIVAVVQPGRRSLRSALRPLAEWMGLREKPSFEKRLREAGVQRLLATGRSDPLVQRMLAETRPDIICISSYRWMLDESVYSAPRFGAINLHPSLLPRHRGPAPLFWVYRSDDRFTGATVHRVTGQADAGPIQLQQSLAVPRGWPVEQMHIRCAELGATMLLTACDQIGSKTASYSLQNEAMATLAPKVPPGTHIVDFDRWSAERVWHFLSGLSPHYREPLADTRNRTVAYGRAGECRIGVKLDAPPGTAVAIPGGWLLQCRDGVVELSKGEEAELP